MINSNKEIRDFYNDIKDAIKYPELIFILILVGIFVRSLFPQKFEVLITHINPKYYGFLSGLVDMIFVYLLVICSSLFILHVIFNILYIITNWYYERKGSSDKKMTSRVHFFHRAYLGSHLRLRFTSRWLFIILGLLYLLDQSHFMNYWTILINSYKSIINNIFITILAVFVSLTLLYSFWFLLSSIYYNYIDLQSFEKDNDQNTKSV